MKVRQFRSRHTVLIRRDFGKRNSQGSGKIERITSATAHLMGKVRAVKNTHVGKINLIGFVSYEVIEGNELV